MQASKNPVETVWLEYSMTITMWLNKICGYSGTFPIMKYYEILGINENATQEEIRKAYKKQALIWHPDKSNDKERFKDIVKAYKVLMDPETRREYDASLHQNFTSFGAGFDTSFDSFFENELKMFHSFDNFFGNSRFGFGSDMSFRNSSFNSGFDSFFNDFRVGHHLNTRSQGIDFMNGRSGNFSSSSTRTVIKNGIKTTERTTNVNGKVTVEIEQSDSAGNIIKREKRVDGKLLKQVAS